MDKLKLFEVTNHNTPQQVHVRTFYVNPWILLVVSLWLLSFTIHGCL